MRVYLLYRTEWHYVDGETSYVVNVYKSLQDAQDKRDRLNQNEAKTSERSGVYFEVVEEYVL